MFNMSREIVRYIEDLLKPINKKLDDLPTKEDFNKHGPAPRDSKRGIESRSRCN